MPGLLARGSDMTCLHLETFPAKEAECVVAEIVVSNYFLFARMLSFGFNHFIVGDLSFSSFNNDISRGESRVLLWKPQVHHPIK